MSTTSAWLPSRRPSPPQCGPLLVLMAAAVLAGCRTPPLPHPEVEAARQALQQAGANPHAVRGGNVELGLARADLARADVAWRDDRDEAQAKHFAHLAHQRALIASQIGLQLEAESKLTEAARQREQLRADAVRRGTTVAAVPATAPNAAPVAPRALTPAPQVPSAEPPVAASQPQAQVQPQTQPSVQPPPPAQQQAQPQAQRPPAPQAASRFDTETAARARREVESQQVARTDAPRSGAATAQPQPAAATSGERDAALRQQLQQMQARNTQRGMVLTLPDVLFESGGAVLKPGSERTLDQLVGLMRRFPERRVLLEGFTDDVGPETINYDLSQRRAEAFRAALLARGADARRIDVSAQGEAFPVARNDTAAGRAQNRRVEVIFSDEQGRFAPR